VKRAALAGAALIIGAGAAGTGLAQQRAPGLVPEPTSVEAGLWSMLDRAERDARHSAELNADPALNAYVRSVACNVAEEYCDELRVYVMDRPALQASAGANGYLEVWSGLLLRADSEAALAFVLGHEVGHYIENHSVERWNSRKGWATAAMVVTAGAGIAGAYYQVNLSGLGDLAYLTAASAYFSYSRGHEIQSDSIGLQRMADAGYDPRAAAEIWRDVQAETRASSFPSVRRSEASNSVFRSHPLTEERVFALEQAAASRPEGGRLERARHRAAIRPFLNQWLDEELKRRDFDGLLTVIDRLAKDGDDLGVLNFYRGEIYRQRRAAGDLILARDAYRTAALHSDAPIAVWRELGDASIRLEDQETAATAWTTYLDNAPAADDRWIVEDSLKTLEKSS
jgi:Zn-dependent protease with chaperone function